MRRIKITAFIALSAVSAFLLILSFTPLAGGAPGIFKTFLRRRPRLATRFCRSAKQ